MATKSETNHGLAISQCLALEKSLKTEENKEGGSLLRTLAKPEPFSGQLRFYTPREDGGETRPREDKKVVSSAKDLLSKFSDLFRRRMNITCTKDQGNASARANVVVDGVVVLADCPPTMLLTLEQKVQEIQGLLVNVTTLPPEENWAVDPNTGLYKSEPDQKASTKKIERVVELSAATDKHPAQVQLRPEDVTVGTWTTIKLSSALTIPEKTALLERCSKLLAALKMAREEANQYRLKESDAGTRVANFLFGG